MMVAHEPKFLSENLIIVPASGKGPKYLFVFPRSLATDVEKIVDDLRERLRRRASAETESILEPMASG